MGKARWKEESDKKRSARSRGLGRFKVYPCVFSNDVLCSYRKDVKTYIMDRCFQCSHYRRFETKMDEEDGVEDREVEEVFRRTAEKKGHEPSGCPICGEPLKEFEYIGKDKSTLAKLASCGEEGCMVEPMEDGKSVWREVRNRKRKRSAS